MSPGKFARLVLGDKFAVVGQLYRRVFVDMNRVIECLTEHIPHGARVLDVGGGDGYAVDLLLARRPDIHLTMTDILPEIGTFIRDEQRDRVTLLPGTDVATIEGSFDVITVMDVVHHVPLEARAAFLDAVAVTAERTGCQKVLVKDVEPGNLRANMSLWSDLYITCDKGVSLAAAATIAIAGFSRRRYMMPDYPNYCLCFAK